MTVWPLALRVSLIFTPAAATFARWARVSTAAASMPDRVCRTPASSTPPAASRIASALPRSVYISSCCWSWP